MKGLNAVQMITALAVGLAVVGISIWFILTWTGKGSSHLTEAQCQAKAYEICSAWYLCDFKEPTVDDPGCKPNNFDNVNRNCTSYFTLGPSYCRSILPF